MKRIGLTLISVLLVSFPLFSQFVEIPDTDFLNALINDGVDTNGDGQISIEEAEAKTFLDVRGEPAGDGISDMTGIEAFVNLDSLDCSYNLITILDLSNNVSLEYLDCQENMYKIWGQGLHLNISNNVILKELHCQYNSLDGLDVSKNILLEKLYCGANYLSSLDVSNNIALKELSCESTIFVPNRLTYLDLSNNIALTHLNCGGNQLASLDVSNNTELTSILLGEMTTLHDICVWTMPFPPAGVDVETDGSTNLYFTNECDVSVVTIPDDEFKNALINFGVDTNGDNLISYAEAEAVTKLDVSLWFISDLTGIEAFINLDTLDAQCNPISIFDVSNNTKLKFLNVSSYGPMACESNTIKSLDLSANPELEYLGWGNNELISLDISNNPALKFLEISGNDLVSLDVSNNTELAVLQCSGSQLTDLDVSNNTSLVDLICDSNPISGLDLTNNPLLQRLWCSSTQISNLDISINTDLSEIRLKDTPTLYDVCVWTVPFPPSGVMVDITESPNLYFTNECDASINVSPNSESVSFVSGSTSFDVSANVTWSVSDDASWLTASKDGNAISVSYEENKSTNPRTASITATGGGVSETVMMVQAGADPFLDVSPNSESVGSVSGSTSFDVSANVTWSVSDDASWLTASKDGNTISVSYGENTSTNLRTASITATGGGASETVMIVQAGADPYLDVSPNSESVGSESGSTSFDISANVTWTVSEDASWLTASKDENTISISYETNTSINSRTANITATGGGVSETVTVVQAGADPYLDVSANSESVSSESGVASFNVSANVTWTVSEDASWLTASKDENTISISYETNTSTNSRTANITATGGGVSETVMVVQAGADPYLDVSANSESVSSESGVASFNVSANVIWTVGSSEGWLVATKTDSSTLTIVYEENTSENERSATITLSGGGLSRYVSCVQEGVSLTAIDIYTDNQTINIYPNPFDNYINVELFSESSPEIIIDVVDMNGRVIEYLYTGILSAEVEHRFEFKTKVDLTPGSYLLRIRTENGEFIGREIIIKR